MVQNHDKASEVKGKFAERLKRLRDARGWTLREAATELGCTLDVLSKYEIGRSEAPYWLLIRMSEVYGVSLDFLIGGKGLAAKARKESVTKLRA